MKNEYRRRKYAANIIKGMDVHSVKGISRLLVDELTAIIGCPRDYFTIEVSVNPFIMDGQETAITPLIQVNWFDRGQNVQDEAAAAIYRHVKRAGYSHVETFFIVLEEARYYENEKHY